jgi:hypothetical protein
MSIETLTTIETSGPGERYSLFETGPNLSLHLAAPTAHGTGPCICGFDRFARDIGFSVGGGVTGPSVKHAVCQECARLIDGRPIKGTNAALFENGI